MDSVQVTNAVTIGVEEGDGIYLVNGSFFPPRPRWNKGRWHRGEECERGSTGCPTFILGSLGGDRSIADKVLRRLSVLNIEYYWGLRSAVKMDVSLE